MADSSSAAPTTVSPVTVTASTPLKRGGVTTFQPKVSVILKKTVGRTTVGADIAASQRFTGARRTIDLTPLLGEAGAVIVSKSVREPAGMFSVTLTDQLLLQELDSAYGIVEPMDIIEIRMARDTSLYSSLPQSMPMMMRGFVSDIRRTRAMSGSGPVRAVTIAGQDYGRILSIIKPLYLVGIDQGADLLTSFGLFDNYGVSAQPQDVSAFIAEVMSKVVNEGAARPGFLSNLIAASATSPIQYIGVDAQAGGGQISPIGTQAWRGGSIMDLFKAFGDVGPWRELYIEDREDGPYLVYRPTPFKDLTGGYIQPIDNPPPRIDVTDTQLMSLDVGRADANVANYFNVTADRYQLVDPTWMQVVALNTNPSPYVSDYPNCDPTLYGVRVMEADTEQGIGATGLPQAEYQAAVQGGMDIVAQRRDALIQINRDNVVLEQGEAQVRGLETLRAGCYVRLTQGAGAVKAEYYCPSVVHTFNAFRSYTTTLQLERGTGFVNRLQQTASPYLAELSIGGVYAAAG